jgi:E1A/CREB-binding protein
VTAARLPYFDGDYWPGAAEDIINQIFLPEYDKNLRKGKLKKTITKRDLKAAGLTDLSGNASKDAMLMQKVYFSLKNMQDMFFQPKFT